MEGLVSMAMDKQRDVARDKRRCGSELLQWGSCGVRQLGGCEAFDVRGAGSEVGEEGVWIRKINRRDTEHTEKKLLGRG
jgi:hypothetical protein